MFKDNYSLKLRIRTTIKYYYNPLKDDFFFNYIFYFFINLLFLLFLQLFINVPWWYIPYYKTFGSIITSPRTRSKMVLAGPSKSADTIFK